MKHSTTRPSAVAGQFYPGQEAALKIMIDELLAQAPQYTVQPKAIIVPHAGYIYSGSTAAKAYASLQQFKQTIKKVVLLGPAHTLYFRGIACDPNDNFITPLGLIKQDTSLRDQLTALPFVQLSAQAHQKEHCLEVQLPLCQSVLDEFTILPLVVGECAKQDVMAVLDKIWGEQETLIIISTDLSHYLTYEQAQKTDQQTCQSIALLQPDNIAHNQACGYFSLRGFLEYAKNKGLYANQLGQCNSGDTAGDKSRVVGYAAYYFYENLKFAPHCGPELCNIAYQTIKTYANQQQHYTPTSQQQHELMNIRIPTFVTLNKNGQLRGCMGSLQTTDTLLNNLQENALKAAFQDPRFPPVKANEVDALELSISILSPLIPLPFKDYDDLKAKLTPNQDGLILKYQGHQATFLPSVWTTLPNPDDFISHLVQKMGLAKGFWSDDITALKYTTEYIN